ncbi:glycosyltransferase [Geomobilimonas luticola]|uniref:Glycosyltransferase n=1 Tax=Geomobilimonas luticola TaxID=1114878 RepID=A0ABS5SC44_9BACT|nr:glycosyltransferase [Geomobilimonas luticola]MBT0652931.1 glycosyltransferase [Geomobilimonas luticola]
MDFESNAILKQNNVVFIKWFPYDKRNEAISNSIGARCLFIHSLKTRTHANAPLRYVLQSIKTFIHLWKEKANTVFVTNPPIFAVAAVALYCAACKGRYVIDSHGGVFNPKWKLAEPLHRYLVRMAQLNIVTNQSFENIYKEWGGKTYIINDLVFDIPKQNEVMLSEKFNIVVVCSFDPDEPVEEIIAAAGELPKVSFYVTGNYQRSTRDLTIGKPDNLFFTGFVPDQDYFDILHSCNAVMVLVTQGNTMQQGAYEAVSVKKPMILSDWAILKETYPEGAIFVDNSKDSIRDGVLDLVNNYKDYCAQMEILHERRKQIWQQRCEYLLKLVNDA